MESRSRARSLSWHRITSCSESRPSGFCSCGLAQGSHRLSTRTVETVDHTLVRLPLEGLTISKRLWLAEAKSGRLADTQVFSHQTASSYPGESAPGTRVFTYSIFTK